MSHINYQSPISKFLSPIECIPTFAEPFTATLNSENKKFNELQEKLKIFT